MIIITIMGISYMFSYKVKKQSLYLKLLIACSLNLLISKAVLAQTPVTAVTLSSSPATQTTVGGDTWGTGNNLSVVDITALGNVYTLAPNNSVKITFKRSGNTLSNPERCRIFAHYDNNDTSTFFPSYPMDSSGNCSMETALLEPILNRGALDVFHNVVAGSSANNVERVDVLTQSPFAAPAFANELDEIGFLATEKNGNNEFNAAVILSVDVAGNPTSFGPLTFINGGSHYGEPQPFYRWNFAENAAFAPHGLPTSHRTTNERIGYTLLTFDNLGVSPSQTIYGISFFGKDVNASHNLLDPDSFPKNTNEGADIHGGLGAVFVGNVTILPVAVDDSQTNLNAASPSNPTVLSDVTANDNDIDGSIDVSSIDLDPSSPGIQTSFTTADGVWTVNASGDVTFTPNAGFSGLTTSIQYTVNDNDGNTSNTANLTVTYPDVPAFPWTPTPGGPYSGTSCLATASPTAPLNDAQVTFNRTGNILDSIDIVGEPNSFNVFVTPDSFEYNFQNTSNVQNQQVRENGVLTSSLAGDGPAVFDPDLFDAITDRNLDHYLNLDSATNSTDFVDFLYNGSVASSGDRYLVVTERNGNNTLSAQAIDINGNLIGNAVPITRLSPNYLGTGVISVFNQEIRAYVYPLTALVPTGTQIYGIRYTQAGATGGDGGDGKVFLMINPTVVCAPELSMTKVADDDTDRKVGDTITYTYTIENIGDKNIQDVTVSDVHNGSGALSAITVGTLTNTSGNSADDSADGDVDILAPNDSVTFTSTYVVTVADASAGSNITNTATATGTPTHGVLADISANESVSVIAPTADVSVTKTLVTLAPYTSGQAITYNITVSNSSTSEGPATNVAITDIPTNLTITSVSSANCSSLPCTIPTLAVGASEIITVQATIP